MQTRIRHLRKMRGWTLRQLAERVGTTAQTIQRLETSNMTVSMDWLQRLADAFNIKPAELISDGLARNITHLGTLSAEASLNTLSARDDIENLSLDIPAEHPVAVRLDEAIGPYPAGVLLIADRQTGPAITNALGRNVLAQNTAGTVILGRLIKGSGETFTLVPIEEDQPVRYDQNLEWAGRIVMTVTYG